MNELEAIVKLNTMLAEHWDPNDDEATEAVEIAVEALRKQIEDKTHEVF